MICDADSGTSKKKQWQQAQAQQQETTTSKGASEGIPSKNSGFVLHFKS